MFIFKGIKRFIKYVGRVSRSVLDSNVPTYTASASYYTLLSFFPILILICALLPLANINDVTLFSVLDDFLPGFILNLCESIYYQLAASRMALVSVAAIFAIWTAGNGVFDIIKGFNSVHGVKEKRNWFVLRISSSIALVLFLVSVAFFLVIMVFGNRFKDALLLHVNSFKVLYSALIHFRFVFVWIITTLVLQFIYTIMPSKKVHFTWQFPGALFASVIWSALSWLFSKYVNAFSANSVYGNFTSIVLAMFWVYWLIYIIMIGCIINYFHEPIFELQREYKRKMKQELKEAKKKRLSEDVSCEDETQNPDATDEIN